MNNAELYVHIPFCLRKCAYCDFLSFKAGEEEKEAYVKALNEEIASRKDIFANKNISSVYFGGGTPTVLKPGALADILETIRENYSLSDASEISVECNPATAGYDCFKELLESGFNRISIGVQSFDDEILKMLGRLHNGDEAIKTVNEASQAGFANINIDLMSGVPGQTLKKWEADLNKAVSLPAKHVSAYSLMLEEGTPLYERRETLVLPDEEEERLMYERTEEVIAEYGFKRYEISNYAKEGYECRHNIGYWTGTPYLGFGLGAASYYDDKRYENIRDLNKYISAASSPGAVANIVEELDKRELIFEFMILGLRMTKGVSNTEFKKRFGADMFKFYGTIIKKYLKDGFLETDGENIRLTGKGISVSNVILADFGFIRG